jgi:hypothetical protein
LIGGVRRSHCNYFYNRHTTIRLTYIHARIQLIVRLFIYYKEIDWITLTLSNDGDDRTNVFLMFSANVNESASRVWYDRKKSTMMKKKYTMHSLRMASICISFMRVWRAFSRASVSGGGMSVALI